MARGPSRAQRCTAEYQEFIFYPQSLLCIYPQKTGFSNFNPENKVGLRCYRCIYLYVCVFSNEQDELPKRRNEADVASQIRLQLRSEIFTQEKTEAPCFPTEEITKRSTSRGRSLGKSIPLDCSENSMFFDLP